MLCMKPCIIAVLLVLSSVVARSEVPKSNSESTRTNSVAHLVQQGKRLYELGKSSEAKAILKQALKIEPNNKAAYYYLDLLKEAEYRNRSAARESDNGEMLLTDPPKSPKTGEWLAPWFVREKTPTLPVPDVRPSLPLKVFHLDIKIVTEKLHLVPDGKTVIQTIDGITYATRGKHYEERNQQIKEWVLGLGVDHKSVGHTVFLNERTGELTIRATEHELALIEAAVQPMLLKKASDAKGEKKP
jgi:tetratricopeptide (TPR) repeat protein